MPKKPSFRSLNLTRDRLDESVRLISRLHGPRAYRVGEPFRDRHTDWEPDASYNLDRDGHTLTIFEPSPSAELVASVASQPAELALAVESPLIILLYRFGQTQTWSSIPYAWHLRQHGRAVQIVPPARMPGEGGALLWVSLVDSETGIVEAQRGTPMTREFTISLHAAIRAQIREPFVPDAYVAAIRSVYECPIPTEELLDRSLARLVID